MGKVFLDRDNTYHNQLDSTERIVNKLIELDQFMKAIGDPSGAGMSFLTGDTNPAAGTGNDGDVYVHTVNGNLYKKEDGSWVQKMNLIGAPGQDGTDGRDGTDGTDGTDGFITEAQYNDILERLQTLENNSGDISTNPSPQPL